MGLLKFSALRKRRQMISTCHNQPFKPADPVFFFFFDCRKRGRNIHEDEMEFMPLSKRINNLHINNTLLLNRSNNNPAISTNSIEWGPGPPYLQNITSNIPTPPESVQSLDWTNTIPQYSPTLNESENPYYFNINKLLFEMYWERQQRAGNTM